MLQRLMSQLTSIPTPPPPPPPPPTNRNTSHWQRFLDVGFLALGVASTRVEWMILLPGFPIYLQQNHNVWILLRVRFILFNHVLWCQFLNISIIIIHHFDPTVIWLSIKTLIIIKTFIIKNQVSLCVRKRESVNMYNICHILCLKYIDKHACSPKKQRTQYILFPARHFGKQFMMKKFWLQQTQIKTRRAKCSIDSHSGQFNFRDVFKLL